LRLLTEITIRATLYSGADNVQTTVGDRTEPWRYTDG